MRFTPHWLGKSLAEFLSRERYTHDTSIATPPEHLLSVLQIGDVLLFDGSSRASTAIKLITQSTWSHAALYVGDLLNNAHETNCKHCFIEVDMVAGVRSIGIEELAGLHTRICRPVGMNETECRQVSAYAIARLGQQYDLRNIVDLARYLFPLPLVPDRLRHHLLALGSGDPTRAICSTLIAQAFQSIHYPILPTMEKRNTGDANCSECVEEIYRLRHHSLFTPRDFDVSPYFQVIKPRLEESFDFKRMHWENESNDTH